MDETRVGDARFDVNLFFFFFPFFPLSPFFSFFSENSIPRARSDRPTKSINRGRDKRDCLSEILTRTTKVQRWGGRGDIVEKARAVNSIIVTYIGRNEMREREKKGETDFTFRETKTSKRLLIYSIDSNSYVGGWMDDKREKIFLFLFPSFLPSFFA